MQYVIAIAILLAIYTLGWILWRVNRFFKKRSSRMMTPVVMWEARSTFKGRSLKLK